jgi:hypothetical protein
VDGGGALGVFVCHAGGAGAEASASARHLTRRAGEGEGETRFGVFSFARRASEGDGKCGGCAQSGEGVRDGEARDRSHDGGDGELKGEPGRRVDEGAESESTAA